MKLFAALLRGDDMEEKNLRKYPKWIKDSEYVERAMEKFANYKARVVINNKRLFMIDWQGENDGTADEMHYILDKERGVFTVYGDLGEAIAYFCYRVEVKDLLSYLYMASRDYFLEKIVAGNPYAIYPTLGVQEIESVYLWVLGFFMACEDAGLRG